MIFEWQPIETAPDRELVLCFAANWDAPCVLSRWPRMDHGGMQWIDDSGDTCQDYHPTHWSRWPKL